MSDIDITLLGDEELNKVLTNLPFKLQHNVLKKVVSDSANPMVKAIKQDAPRGATGNLYRSIGKVAGRSKRNAVVFVGPRLGGGGKRGAQKGWVANILEFSKGKVRRPKGQFLATPWGPRRFVGPLQRIEFVEPNIRRTLKVVENNFTNSVRKIIGKELKKVR